MDLHYSEEDEAYRSRLQAWLAGHAAATGGSGGGAGGGTGRGAGDLMEALHAARAWQRTLWEAGYLGLSWPRAYGGQAATLTQQVIVAEELARFGAPPLINTIGLTILGPTLVVHGTEAQRQRFLPKILSAEELWCQGFSEPEAGSDLAALRTRAVVDGDDLVVTGQKVWTSLAPIADWCFLLARTDPDAPKHDGISYLLCDMRSPGVTVNPIRNAGGGLHFSEVFFDEVRIPSTNLVGELHGGWQIVRTTLGHERSGLSNVVSQEQTLDRLWATAADLERAGQPATDDPAVARALARAWMDIEGLRHLGYRTLSAQLAGRSPGAESSVGKLFASQLRLRLAALALEVEGPLAQLAKRSPHVVDRGRWVATYFDALGHSIGGGTAEIQRNTIAERILGLPRSVVD
jgi:alkylation response protein AidB-like acyl-CoA dehydrogenase